MVTMAGLNDFVNIAPVASGAVGVLLTALALYLLKIPQGARILGQGFRDLVKVQEETIRSMSTRLKILEEEHAECMKKHAELVRRCEHLEHSLKQAGLP